MHISYVACTEFMRYKDLQLLFPPTGIVLVTGPNGSGKSSLLEIVSQAIWGESIRGKPPWHDAAGSATAFARVGDRLYQICRTRRKSSKLEFGLVGHGFTPYDTATKAQEALDEIVPSYEVWRRARVFTSQDADHFTLSTDASRKRFLEGVLGLDRFDEASSLCRADLRAAVAESEKLARAVEVAANRVEEREHAYAEAQDRLASAKPVVVPQLEADLKKLEVKIRKLQERILQTAEANEKLRDKAAELKQAVKSFAARLVKLRSGQCGECGQPFPLATVVGAEADFVSAKKQLEKLPPIFDDTQNKSTLEALKESRAELLREMRDAERKNKEYETLKASVVSLAKRAEEAQDLLGEAKSAQTAADHALAELRAADQVLSIGGVRSHMLNEALRGIEAVTNYWLRRMSPNDDMDLGVKLSPYSEKASGGVKDAIAIEILGASGGFGYKAASSGERRRIDVAMMLGLATLAEGTDTDGGTMFYDEVFDALDSDGTTGVCDILEEISRNKCVVLITHNEGLVSSINARMTVRVQDGRVEIR